MSQQGKKSRKVALIILSVLIVVVAAVLSSSLIKKFNDQFQDDAPVLTSDDPRLAKEESVPEGEWVVAADMPRYISIDKLGIQNARVVQIGIKSDTENQLDDPTNIHDVGWYRKSVKPGAGAGPASLAGLYDGHNTGHSTDGVFINLGRLAVGDLIKVERGDGQIFTYEVREVQTPSLDEIDTDFMALMQKSAEKDVEGLNIISCTGDWDKDRKTYSHRVAIRAVLQ